MSKSKEQLNRQNGRIRMWKSLRRQASFWPYRICGANWQLWGIAFSREMWEEKLGACTPRSAATSIEPPSGRHRHPVAHAALGALSV